MEDKVEVCICYAHKDEALMRELESQLSTLVQQGLIEIWHDRKIIGGADWQREIEKHLNSAQIILLLISASFMASDYSHTVEVKRAMEKYNAGEAQVIPVILRPVSWRGAPFGRLTPFPKDGKPVTSWSSYDDAFFNVVEGVEAAIGQLNARAEAGTRISMPLPLLPNPGDISPPKEAHMPQPSPAKGNKKFDVFLCHNTKNKPEVKRIAEQLKARGVEPWLDEWELRPGLSWQRLLEEQIDQINTVAVFVGKDGIGPWQHMELNAYLRKFVSLGCPVIPVLLADALSEPALPLFLQEMQYVDFRKPIPDPMGQLIWGITGHRPGSFPGMQQESPLVQARRGELEDRLKRLSEKIKYFEEEYDHAADPDIRYSLKKKIEREKTERDKVETELHKLQ